MSTWELVEVPPEYNRVYTQYGKAAHYTEQGTVTLCRIWDLDTTGFLGTGSQLEYEHASALPLCKTCAGGRRYPAKCDVCGRFCRTSRLVFTTGPEPEPDHVVGNCCDPLLKTCAEKS